MKFLFAVMVIIGVFCTCTNDDPVSGTGEDVGTVSGRLLTKEGKPIDYAVTVALFKIQHPATSVFPAGFGKIRSNGEKPFRESITDSGSYKFDFLPGGEYRIRVTEDGIVVAEEGGLTLANDQSRNDTIHVDEVMSLAFVIDTNKSQKIVVAESTIDNCRIITTESGYIIKTVKARECTFKMVIQQQNLAIDTVEVRASVDSEGTTRYEVIDGAVDFTVIADEKGTGAVTGVIPPGMKFIPSGNFTMGPDPATGIVRMLILTHDFLMDSTEVTQQNYAALMKTTYRNFQNPPWDTIWGMGENYPAHYLNWYDAALYCNARTKAAGLADTIYRYESIEGNPGARCILNGLAIDLNNSGYHLPTEAQWEYACRAGTTTDNYFDSASIDYYAWQAGDSAGRTFHPVARKLPNAYGLYDMIGNVKEWCNDLYQEYGVAGDPHSDPTGPASTPSGLRVSRGGSSASVRSYLTSFHRISEPPGLQIPINGFRVCYTIR